MALRAINVEKHEHGWEGCRTSGGMMNAVDGSISLDERSEQVYKTAYATGHKNGFTDRSLGDEQIIDEQGAIIAGQKGRIAYYESVIREIDRGEVSGFELQQIAIRALADMDA